MSYASLCVCAYNRPDYLRKALSTAVTNPGAPFELLIHDDGSPTMDMEQVLRAWNYRATIVTNPPGHNLGRGVAMKRLFDLASGDPLIVADHDLLFKPGWLARVREFLDRYPQIGLLSGYRYWHKPCDWRDTLIAQHDGWSEHEYVMGSFMAIPRQVYEALGPFETGSEAFAEDHDFQRKVAASGLWVCGTPDEDLMGNQGYGLGRSTVAIPGADGGIATQPIFKVPVLVGE